MTLTNITIPNSVTSIGSKAFYYSMLSTISIPNSVTSIGSNAFTYTQLTSITIPDSVTTLENRAFRFNLLKSITISASVTIIDEETFYKSLKLQTIAIPDSVTTINAKAFAECHSLTSVTLTESITSIGTDAFLNSPINQVCGVDATQAPFSGQSELQVQDTQAQCTEPVCPDGVSGVKWCRPPPCTTPDTTGYAVTETDLALASFNVTASCAPLYVGTASASACSADG